MSLPGFATPEGTERYRQRFVGRAGAGHFRQQDGLWLSSVGAGTYLGEPDGETDERYACAIARALELGVNVVDTAINYRFQRSERAIAAALAALVTQGRLSRDEVVISTKAGFLTFDGVEPPDPYAYFQEHYLRPGILAPEDVVGGMHSITPRYLEDQIGRSRRNLGLETIDIFFLHNPETQLSVLPREEFLGRLRRALEKLEEMVDQGAIGRYGTATWDGYRRPPGARDHLSLQELVQLAREVRGLDHHFKVIQLPYNLVMAEAFLRPTQMVDGKSVSLLEAARRLGMGVYTSASILQGQMARNFPVELRAPLDGGLKTDAQRAIQFVRSTPGVVTALVGMSRTEHVEENLQLVDVPVIPPDQFLNLFRG
jgi:aryl-alcohol dehydrogenase-like predicted oxidoreductase